jgi:hypothetical protein
VEKWGGEVVEEFFVLVEERFALRGVGNDEGNAGSELSRSGETAAAGSDDAEFGYTVDGHSAGPISDGMERFPQTPSIF